MAKFVTVEILRDIDLPASIAGGAALALNRVTVQKVVVIIVVPVIAASAASFRFKT